MALTPVYGSDGFFNEEAARAAFELVMKMDDDEARVFTTMVTVDVLWDTIEKNQRTLQRHLDEVIAKQASTAMEVLSKRADGEEIAAAIAKALNPYDYGYKFDENDFNRDRRTGRFKTKINYTATKPLNDKTARSYGLPTKKMIGRDKRISNQAVAEYQQGYMQVANFLDAFREKGLAADNDFLYSIENRRTGRVRTQRRQDTTIPDFDPEIERITEIEARPAGLTAAGASFGLVSALGGSDRATWVAADKMKRFEDKDQGFNAFGNAWLDSGDEVTSSNDRLYGRVKTGSEFLGHMSYGNPKLEMAAQFGRLVGQHGPQAEKVIGPKARVTMYRYRGTEKTPDSDLTREYAKAMRSPTNVDGSEFGTIAQRLAIRHMVSKVPDQKLYDLNLKAGHTPPSEGLIIDKNGKMVTQAIGYGDDHYLPFNLKNLAGLRGGEYVRTRSVGGPTAEDIYTGLVAGAQRITVVSRSGIFIVEFDDTFRGTRRYNDKAGRMVDRYEKLVDAVKSEQVTRQPLEPSVRQAIRDEVNRTMDFASPKERQKAIARKEDEYRMYPRITAEDEKMIEQRVGNLAVTDERTANKMRAELRNNILESKSYNFRLNGDGYAAALKALQEQFPYYIANVQHVTLDEAKPFATETDRGYVKPRHNRPAGAWEGYFDASIAGEPKAAAAEGTGKYRADTADYQNWKHNPQRTGRLTRVVSDEEGATEATEGATESSATEGSRRTGNARADALAARIREREVSDNFATKAWELRNVIHGAGGAPTKESERGYALFQLGENEFKEAVKTKTEDLEFVLAPYKDRFLNDPQFAVYRPAVLAYEKAKGVAGGVPFERAKHLGTKPTNPFAFTQPEYSPGGQSGPKRHALEELSRRTKLASKPLAQMMDDKEFMNEIERLQGLRKFAQEIAELGADDEALAVLRANGQLGGFSTEEISAMRTPEVIDDAIENTHRAWTLRTQLFESTGRDIDRMLSTPSAERGELPKVVEQKPATNVRVVTNPAKTTKDREVAGEDFQRAIDQLTKEAEQLEQRTDEKSQRRATYIGDLIFDLRIGVDQPFHAEAKSAWDRYFGYINGSMDP